MKRVLDWKCGHCACQIRLIVQDIQDKRELHGLEKRAVECV